MADTLPQAYAADLAELVELDGMLAELVALLNDAGGAAARAAEIHARISAALQVMAEFLEAAASTGYSFGAIERWRAKRGRIQWSINRVARA